MSLLRGEDGGPSKVHSLGRKAISAKRVKTRILARIPVGGGVLRWTLRTTWLMLRLGLSSFSHDKRTKAIGARVNRKPVDGAITVVATGNYWGSSSEAERRKT